MTSLLFITSSLLITSLLVTTCLGQKTANEVAAALKDQELCSASIENNACVSNQLMSPEEWQGVEAMKQSVIAYGKENLCSTECGEGENKCGPIYLYITQFNVLPDGVSRADFAESFSLDLLNALNADKAGVCDASFLLFFSQADRLIALRAPEDSYLYPHTGEIYQSVKGYYSKGADEANATSTLSLAQATNATLTDIRRCLLQENGMCKDSSKLSKELVATIILLVGVLILGSCICSLLCISRGGIRCNLSSLEIGFDDV